MNSPLSFSLNLDGRKFYIGSEGQKPKLPMKIMPGLGKSLPFRVSLFLFYIFGPPQRPLPVRF